jgi:hypothetical protein
MSSINSASQQFRRWAAQPSNVDKCARCQMPRSVHGADWACPSALPHRVSTALLMAGIVLTLSGVIVRLLTGSAAQPGQAMLMADAFLVGVVLMIAGVVTGGRQHSPGR